MAQSKEELEPPDIYNVPAGIIGICSQSGEISVATNVSNPIPRVSNQLRGNENQDGR